MTMLSPCWCAMTFEKPPPLALACRRRLLPQQTLVLYSCKTAFSKKNFIPGPGSPTTQPLSPPRFAPRVHASEPEAPPSPFMPQGLESLTWPSLPSGDRRLSDFWMARSIQHAGRGEALSVERDDGKAAVQNFSLASAMALGGLRALLAQPDEQRGHHVEQRVAARRARRARRVGRFWAG